MVRPCMFEAILLAGFQMDLCKNLVLNIIKSAFIAHYLKRKNKTNGFISSLSSALFLLRRLIRRNVKLSCNIILL